jgi:glutamyl-tRNA reductase
MTFLACGINHKTAPIEVREKISAANDEHNAQLLSRIMALEEVSEAAILSTCNRTELYCVTQKSASLVPWLANEHNIGVNHASNYFYEHKENHGIRHAMRVACGLDSMMLGEPQILGQMKKAFHVAETAGTIGPTLRPIFHHVFSASKRIRTRTGIGINPVSVAYASVNLIKKIFSNDIIDKTVFLIGSGETSQLVAKYLQQAGTQSFFIASRTIENATELSNQIHGTPLTIGEIPDVLPQADIIISATACPLPFISKGLVKRAMAERAQQPMFLLDLAIPRDIEQDVHELDNVHLYNVDDMQNLVDEGLSERTCAADHAEQIIDYEMDEYIRWHRSLRAKDTIIRYREHTETLAEKELQRAIMRLKAGHTSTEEILQEFKHRLVNKLIHKPSTGLKRAAIDDREDVLALISYLLKD